MSARTDAALAEFRVAMADPTNLFDIHSRLRAGPGRRWQETTLNRAIVVLTVAAWQAYIEDLARAILVTLMPIPGTTGAGLWPLVKAATDSSLSRFNTPNAENTRNVLSNVGFDPRPHWAWTAGPTTVTADMAADRMNEWLRVRHRIAHGDELPHVSVLSRTPLGVPTLKKSDARKCMRLFERVVALTAHAASRQFP